MASLTDPGVALAVLAHLNARDTARVVAAAPELFREYADVVQTKHDAEMAEIVGRFRGVMREIEARFESLTATVGDARRLEALGALARLPGARLLRRQDVIDAPAVRVDISDVRTEPLGLCVDVSLYKITDRAGEFTLGVFFDLDQRSRGHLLVTLTFARGQKLAGVQYADEGAYEDDEDEFDYMTDPDRVYIAGREMSYYGTKAWHRRIGGVRLALHETVRRVDGEDSAWGRDPVYATYPAFADCSDSD